ncbi:MAG TPA: hypothetical protein ENI20_11810 [Bacteroides sp.]|nr:hypothetical protein [Bacteroides sp.]
MTVHFFKFPSSNSIRTILFLLLSLQFVNASGQQKTDSPWYADKLLRIYHPNMKNWEVTGFDVTKFVDECVALNAEAIVVNAGGIYSFYPSKINHHNPNPFIGSRDLFGEICKEAKKRDLKIIARFDFAGAASELSELHPGWFHQNKDGSFKSHRGSGSRFSTTPTGGYQNEDFAQKVLHELMESYEFSGIHLNASGFDGVSYDRVSMEKYGSLLQGEISENPELAGEFNLWRQRVVEEMILDYRKILHEKNENILLMAEIAGAESPGWAYRKGFDNYRLSNAFTNLLLTSGRMKTDLYRFRYWVGLSADMAHATMPDNLPIINLKVHSAGFNYSDFQVPVEEFKLYSYQAIAHNAGLKIPTYGILHYQLDTRTKELVSSIFEFMKKREKYAVNPKKISQVALVYPKMGIEDIMVTGEEVNIGLRNEFLGLYRAMAGKHVQLEVLYDNILTEYDLEKYNVMVVPSMVHFNDRQIETIYHFMENGGRVVMLDNSYSGNEFNKIPDLFHQLCGITWTTINGTGNYAVPSSDYPGYGIIKGPLGLSSSESSPNYRLTKPSDDCKLWLNASLNNVYRVTPEDIGKIETGDNAVLWSKKIGEGDLVYFGNGLGEMMYHYDHPDYTELLFKMIFHEGSNPPLLVTNAPSTVEITFNETRNGYLIQFVNSTGKTPLDEIIPLSNISVSISKQLPVDGMLHQPGREGSALEGSMEQGKTTFTIQQLKGFAEIFLPDNK